MATSLVDGQRATAAAGSSAGSLVAPPRGVCAGEQVPTSGPALTIRRPDIRSAYDRGVAMADDVGAGDRSSPGASELMTTPGPELDAARARVVARNLTVPALRQLTPLVAGLGLSL